MNAGQDINSVNGPVILTKDYLQDEAKPSQATVPDNESLVQNDAADPGAPSLQGDQLPQQEQISEVVPRTAPRTRWRSRNQWRCSTQRLFRRYTTRWNLSRTCSSRSRTTQEAAEESAEGQEAWSI